MKTQYLPEANRERILAFAAGRTRRQFEELVAEIAPRPDVPDYAQTAGETGEDKTYAS